MDKYEVARYRPTRSALCRAIASSLLLGAMLPVAAQTATYQEEGTIGDAASWRSDEFVADWGLGAIGTEYAYARGLTGAGVRLGVFDSGSALAHPEFGGRDHRSIRIADTLVDGSACASEAILAGPDACFMSDGDQVSIDYFHYTDADRALVQYLTDIGYFYPWVPEYLESIAGFQYGTHGTHVAGTMAAGREGNGTHGVGFNADLSVARLFSNSYADLFAMIGQPGGQSYATGPDSAAVASMYQQMAAHGVRAINHSWGLSSEPTTAFDMDALYNSPGVAEYFATYTDPSVNDKMIQVFAAGNAYGEIAGIYATLPRWVSEAEPYWLSVVNINAGGVIDPSSSICGLSANWCITAPGTDIASTVVGGEIEGELLYDEAGNFIGYDITAQNPEYGYGYMTGTSMAAPHVTGALALLMERFPYLDNAQVRDVMLTTATDLGAAGVDEIYGWGLVDLKKAIEGPGQIRVDTDVVMNQHAGGAKVWEGLAWDDWTNDIGGPGRLGKSGIGWLRLSGDNSFGGLTVNDGVLELTGANRLGDTFVEGGWALVADSGSLANAVTVNGGQLTVDGIHSGELTVNAGGTLGGHGRVGTTVMAGTLAPGNSLGTLTVDGDYTQLAESVYVAEIAPPDASDHLQVTGVANLLGGTVRVVQAPGEYLLGQSYDILAADGGITGQFDAIDASLISPFLAFDLGYGSNAVMLDVARGMALAEAAQTRNQRAVAASADALADSNPLLLTLTQLFPEQAVAAFDALGGELHASTRSALLEDSRQVREAALDRAQPQLSPVNDGEAVTAAWAQAYGSGGTLRSDGNAGQVDRNGGGVLVGVDHRFAGGWSIGALGGTGRTDLGVPSRASSADVDSRHLGVYAGNHWGDLSLRAGVSHASHQVDSERRVAFADVAQTLVADYDASSTQAFLEGAYRFGGDRWTLVPYAQVAHVEVDSDGFGESGGSTALEVAGSDTATLLSTIGVRFDLGLSGSQQAADWLHLRGGLGWRHANGDLVSTAQANWSGAQAFTVAGAPMAESSTVLETGVAAWLSPRSLLELNYSGQYADEARDHGVNLRWSLQF
ncbi:autotransporter domain-containing protein [Novilysobacter erysipheiresistens]|uniref:Autotransporter domain-containing protein n=1 Tax=Novilysobacter erysipheiresistens TaxID=1749332 RepID=A0ABU7YYF6_9GAMM